MKKLIFPILLCILLSGCYDSRETDDLSYVIAIGIDKGNEKNFSVTLQYAVPLNISPEGGDGSPFHTLTLETDNIQSATLKASSKISKTTDLSHLSLIVFSEETAKDGISGLKDDLSQSVKTVPDAYFAVCKGKAKDCLDAVSSPLELNPTKFYEAFFEDDVSSPYTVKQTALEFFSGKTDFALPFLNYGKSLSTSGMAVFKNGKFISLFSLEETFIYNLLKNKFTDALIETEKGIYKINSEIPPSFSVKIQKNPLIKIKLTLSGEAKTGEKEILSNEKSATKDITSYLKSKILLLLEKTKKEDCDILSLSSHAKRKFLTENDFSDYKWHEKYKDAQFEINIKFKNSKNSHGG